MSYNILEFQYTIMKLQHPSCTVVTVIQVDKQPLIPTYFWNMHKDHVRFLEAWKELRRSMLQQLNVEVFVAGLRPGKSGDMSNDNPGQPLALNSDLIEQLPISTYPTLLVIEQIPQISSPTLLIIESFIEKASFTIIFRHPPISQLCTSPRMYQ